MQTLDKTLVRMLLDSAQNQFITVSFIKKDGTERTLNGQLKAASRLVGSERGQAQSAAMKARGQVWLAMPDGSSRSFYLDKVTGLKTKGASVTPRPELFA